ncbi:hypothetical protein LJR045_002896 [Microbacterium sp. LjRoot45]|uniref:hypothetical protein n=1 Tax=Microbacterium sp. LjRoot45 TaxID=3342329 RepID=UPI003ED0182A
MSARKIHRNVLFVAAIAALCLTVSPAAATAANHVNEKTGRGSMSTVNRSTPPDDRLAGLSRAEINLYKSDAMKRIVIDASDGSVESVEPLTTSQLRKLQSRAEGLAVGPRSQGVSPLAVSAGCSSTTPCWYGVGPVYNYSFTVGTTNGTWGNRGDFYTGNYFAKLCWIDPMSLPTRPITYCMPERNGKKAWISLGQSVTGTRVNLSTSR